MGSQQNLNGIKFLVLSMGFVLVGGVVLLAGLVTKKVSHDLSPSETQACAPAHIDVADRGTIVDTAVEKGHIVLTLSPKTGGLNIITFDLCSGKALQTVTIKGNTALRK